MRRSSRRPTTASRSCFFTGNDRLEYRAGHFLTIDPHQFEALDRFTAFLEDLKGRREPPRAYSMSSAPHEKGLAVTVKEEQYIRGTTRYPPLLSPLLVRGMQQGMLLVVPEDIETKTDHLVHLCAGSGSVPNLSTLKFALHAHPRLQHTFIYSNKTWADVMFRNELSKLEREHPRQLRVIHTLTREANLPAGGRAGRESTALLRESIPDPGSCWVYVCGPANSAFDRTAAKESGRPPQPRFLETAIASLGEIGIPLNRINRESYG